MALLPDRGSSLPSMVPGNLSGTTSYTSGESGTVDIVDMVDMLLTQVGSDWRVPGVTLR